MKKIIAVLFLCSVAGQSMAQVRHNNKFPSPESATYDNNGNDLRGFINANKTALMTRGAIVNEASGNTWGYLQVKTVKTPGENKKGELNYYESFNVTLALYKSPDGAKATWWAREYNNPKGPMLYYKAGDPGMLSIDNVKYSEIITDLVPKKMTLVEYFDSSFSSKDFDVIMKNCLFMKGGTIKDNADYNAMIDFYNGFLGKFSEVNDAVLDNKSFITFFKNKGNNYVGYFNIVNGKLSGYVELIDAPFERDRIKLINDIFKKLTGSYIYIYGDDTFGMEKMIKQRADKSNIKTDRRMTTMSSKFNQDQ